jgi:hypothetical protein
VLQSINTVHKSPTRRTEVINTSPINSQKASLAYNERKKKYMDVKYSRNAMNGKNTGDIKVVRVDLDPYQ